MVERYFYLKMKRVLESELYTERLLERTGLDPEENARRNFIVKTMYFLIGTRDFNGISKFLNRYYRDVYPFEYLKEYTDLDDNDIEEMVYRNILFDGFLFHITPQSNVENILANGLLTLNDKYSCDMYQRCNEVNETYTAIKNRNQGLDILKMRQIVSIPGITGYEHDRFHNVFLSSSLDYALKTYGQNGELSTMFLRDIFWAFGIKQDREGLSKEDIKNIFLYNLNNRGINIYDKEVQVLLNFIDLIYEEQKEVNESKKAIVMVPVKDIKNSSPHFNRMYKSEEMISWPLSLIHEYHSGEIQNVGSISPESIMIVDTNEDNSFVLRKGV